MPYADAMNRPTHAALTVLGALLLTLQLGGCATERPTTMTVTPAAYQSTFDATRDALRDHGFTLDRVDARFGVITTKPRESAGLATPWSNDQSTLYQEWDDLLNRNERSVRVTFEPEANDTEPQPEGFLDLRDATEPLTMRVRVVVSRRYRPGWRVETTAVRLSTYQIDPALSPRGMRPTYAVPFSEDERLAARLLKRVQDELRP